MNNNWPHILSGPEILLAQENPLNYGLHFVLISSEVSILDQQDDQWTSSRSFNVHCTNEPY